MDYKLTVLIPTYNRKNELLETLLVLQNQTTKAFGVFISDNASNYNIEEDVLSQLDSEFKNRIIVHKNKYNVGGSYNLLGLFNFCDTEWGWILGDDDIIYYNSIETILNLIGENPDVGMFWYSLVSLKRESQKLQNILDFVQIAKAINFFGDVIFCSNKIYNMREAGKYLETAYRYSYTRFPQCFPMFEMLKSKIPVMVIFGKKIVKHSGSIGWDFNKTTLGMRTITDYNPEISFENRKEFIKQLGQPFTTILKMYIKDDLPWNYKTYLKSIYHDTYGVYGSFIKKCIVYSVVVFLSTKRGFLFGHWVYKSFENRRRKSK